MNKTIIVNGKEFRSSIIRNGKKLFLRLVVNRKKKKEEGPVLIYTESFWYEQPAYNDKFPLLDEFFCVDYDFGDIQIMEEKKGVIQRYASSFQYDHILENVISFMTYNNPNLEVLYASPKTQTILEMLRGGIMTFRIGIEQNYPVFIVDQNNQRAKLVLANEDYLAYFTKDGDITVINTMTKDLLTDLEGFADNLVDTEMVETMMGKSYLYMDSQLRDLLTSKDWIEAHMDDLMEKKYPGKWEYVKILNMLDNTDAVTKREDECTDEENEVKADIANLINSIHNYLDMD